MKIVDREPLELGETVEPQQQGGAVWRCPHAWRRCKVRPAHGAWWPAGLADGYGWQRGGRRFKQCTVRAAQSCLFARGIEAREGRVRNAIERTSVEQGGYYPTPDSGIDHQQSPRFATQWHCRRLIRKLSGGRQLHAARPEIQMQHGADESIGSEQSICRGQRQPRQDREPSYR
ncbi:MAG TPA: hypothetical protein VEQ17_06505, partial [Steroidobacteraceae bacterium]|nr:hypothetical protein [Steroidobacteraceae bacterium]